MGRNLRAKGFLFATFSGILWGITGPVGQYLFNSKNIVPEWLVSYRLLLAGILLLFLTSITKKGMIFTPWKNKKDALHLVLYSIAGMMTVQYSFFVAVKASNGGTATVLQYLNPAMMLIFFAVIKKKFPKKHEVFAVLLALIGIFFLSTNGNLHSLAISPWGLTAGLLCALCTCVYSLLPGQLLKTYGTQVICGWANLVGGIALTLWKRPWTLGIKADQTVWFLFILLVLLGTVLPFAFSLQAFILIGPVYTNLLASVEPVVASIVTWAVLGTRFGKVEILGFVCIIATIIILAVQRE